MRNRKGQSALEYAALITLLAAVVAFFLMSNNQGLNKAINDTYKTSGDKVTAAQQALNKTMQIK